MLIESRVKKLARVVNRDGTPMRLGTCDNVIQSHEVMVRLLKATNNEGVSMQRSPILVKPLQVRAIGIISALKKAG